MVPLSSSVMTSYRLPIKTIDLSPIVFATALTCHGQTDGIGLAKGGRDYAVHRPPTLQIRQLTILTPSDDGL